MIIHVFKAFILPSSVYSIYCFLQNHPGVKYLVRQGMESIPSPKQQRRLLPSPMYIYPSSRLRTFISQFYMPMPILLSITVLAKD